MNNYKAILLLIPIIMLYFSATIIAQKKFMEKPPTINDTNFHPDSLAGSRRGYIEGYTQAPSFRPGDIVSFCISTLAAYTPVSHSVTPVTCYMKIYRVSSLTRDQDFQADPNIFNFQASFLYLLDRNGVNVYPEDSLTNYLDAKSSNFAHGKLPVNYKTGCNWATTFSYQIPSYFQSGYYYAKLYLLNQETIPEHVGYIPFVVKAPSTGATSNMLCVIPWNTYQAYNYWGGGSLYWWLGFYDQVYDGSSIKTVSFRRPFGWIVNIFGNTKLRVSNQFGQLDDRERAFIAWAENNGYRMDYCVDSDLDQGTVLTNQTYKMVIFPGHTEYWTKREKDNIQLEGGFIGRGGNLSFYASNNCFWKIDYNSTGVPGNPDNMFCNKDANGYLWRNQVPPDPEAKFIGVQFVTVNGENGAFGNRADTVRKQNHWIFRNTGVVNGSPLGLGGNPYYADPLATGESDMVYSGISPSNVQKLANARMGTVPDIVNPNILVNAYSDVAYYEKDTTNSRIFAAGGMGWDGCLWGNDMAVIRTMTSNIHDHFNWKKYIGNVYTDVNHKLTWINNIQLDGYVNVLNERYLVADGTISPITVQIDSTLNVYGTFKIKGNVTFSGTGNIIVQNNGILLIDPGATITLTNGKSIIINNSTITALASSNSPITIDFVSQRTSSPFNGIIMNSGSTGNFSSSVIKNAYYGLSAYSSVVAMTNCDISGCYNAVYLNYISNSSIFYLNKFHDNTSNGINLFSNSSPYITQNQFYNNFNGVLCQDNSSPSFRDNSSSYTGKNDIYQNRMGFTCSAATPWLGSQTLPTFNNMIENNNTNNLGYDVRLYNGCTVQASKVWWGSPGTNPPTNPYIKIYYGTGGGTLVMLSPLQSRPSSMLAKALAANTGGGIVSPQSIEPVSAINASSPYDQLYQAEYYFSQKNYSLAEDICKYIIETYPDSAASLPAVDLLCNVANESRDNTLRHYLEKFQSKGPKNLYGKIERILAGYEKENRIQKLDNVIKKYSNFPIQVQCAMLEQVVYCLYELNDYNNALSVYQKMKNLFPDEFSTLQVEDVLGLSQKTNQNSQLINKDIALNTKPDMYELNVNYPNPFNPNTKIKFALPEDNLTTLKVFDALGREVATLVNGVRQAGSYEITFNAENLPSGLYIYQIKSGKFIASRKMLLMK